MDADLGKELNYFPLSGTTFGEVNLATFYQNKAVECNKVLVDDYTGWAKFMLHNSLRDGGDHEARLLTIFEQLAGGRPQLKMLLDDVISYGYLLRGIREFIWERYENADECFRYVSQKSMRWNTETGPIITDILIHYEIAFGALLAQQISGTLFKKLERILGKKETREMRGVYCVNQAFNMYKNKDYPGTVRKAVNALLVKPGYIFNRGVLSILLRSAFLGTLERIQKAKVLN